MSDTLVATLGGLCAAIFWGWGDWFVAKTSRKNPSLEVNMAFQIPGVILATILLIATRQHINSTHNILVLFLAGIIFSFAFLAFIRAFKAGATGLVAPAGSTYPVFTILLTAIFLTFSFSHLQILAMVTVVIGVMMLGYEKRKKDIPLHVQHQATILALTAALLWGVGNVFQNSVISNETWEVIFFTINISIAVMAVIFLLLMSEGSLIQKTRRIMGSTTAIKAGAIYTVGSIGFYYSSVKVGSIIIPLVVSSTSPLVASALGAVYDGERLSLLKRTGAIIAVLGIVLINI